MYLQVQTTVASEEQALRIAGELVERRLAACVQVAGPILSTYRWEGQVEHAREWLCLIKTRESLYPRLEHAIRELHDYDTPEIIATPITHGSRDYLNWLAGQVVE